MNNNFNYLILEIGGFSSSTHYIKIDVTLRKPYVQYFIFPAGSYVNFKNKKEFKEQAETLSSYSYKHYFTEEELEDFLYRLSALKIEEWEKEYLNSYILDGDQWELYYKVSDLRLKSISGSNDYPANWQEFFTLIESFKEETQRKYREFD